MRENLAEIRARGVIPRRRGRYPMMSEFSARERERDERHPREEGREIRCYREVLKTSARPTSLKKISRTRRRLLTCLHFSYAATVCVRVRVFLLVALLVESTYGSLARWRRSHYTRTQCVYYVLGNGDVNSVGLSHRHRRGETPTRRMSFSGSEKKKSRRKRERVSEWENDRGKPCRRRRTSRQN